MWPGPLPGDIYNGKTVLDWNGRPAFAELAILWSMMDAGWSGVWIDTYRKIFRRGYWDNEPVTLPEVQEELLKRIYSQAGSMFLESKRNGKDRIRNSQVRFLAAALDVGVPLESFLMVEWSIRAKPAEDAD